MRAPAVHPGSVQLQPLAAIARLFPKLVEAPGVLVRHRRPRPPPGDARAARLARRRRTCSSSRARLPSAFSWPAELFLFRAIATSSPCRAMQARLHGQRPGPRLPATLCRPPARCAIRARSRTDGPAGRAAGLPIGAAQRRPRGPGLIGHSYLISGLSDVERRARGKRPESRTNAEAATKSSPASRSAPAETSQVLRGAS